jgi:uncharacterized protein (TIGR02266 family)
MGDWVQPTLEEQDEIREAEEAAKEQRERIAAERRTSMRMKLHAKVTVQSESNFFMGFSENISEGGIFVSSLSPPALGTRVELSVGIEDSEPIPVVGVVRWHRQGTDGATTGCGVEFSDISDDVRRQLEALLIGLEKDPLFYET